MSNTHNSANQSHYDVVIAGAGPVGLFLACELALAKCSVLILEKSEHLSSPLKQIPFGIRGLSAPSIEALYRRGLLQELEVHKRLKSPHANSGQGARRQVGHFAGIPFHEGDIDRSRWTHRLPASTETSLISEIAELEAVFTRRAEALGVVIRRGFAVTDVQQTEYEVSVQANGQRFTGKWLVGCDGGRSLVRKSGGFEFAGTEPEFTGYSTQIELADPEKLKPGRNLTAAGMYLQSQPGYVIMQDFDGGAFHNADTPITLAHVQAVLRRLSNTDVCVTALHAATTWTDRARQATNYRNGRILLAGDAAHIHSPLGGQGLNLGLGDAMNLGWKLAATIQHRAPQSLLDTYHAERYPVGVDVLDWSRTQVAIMKPDPQARALHAIIRDLMGTQDGATYFAGRVWGLHTSYDLNSEQPLVGKSVPNFEFDDGSTIGEQMRDGQAILLDFHGDDSLKNLSAEYGERLKYLSHSAQDTLGVSALLIRPDGIVAWAGVGEPDEQLIKQAIAGFLQYSNTAGQ